MAIDWIMIRLTHEGQGSWLATTLKRKPPCLISRFLFPKNSYTLYMDKFAAPVGLEVKGVRLPFFAHLSECAHAPQAFYFMNEIGNAPLQ